MDDDAPRHVEAVRRFNRFYAAYLDALNARLAGNDFSLTEVRVLSGLAQGDAQTAAALARELLLDTGYLSRILTGFEKCELILRRPSATDARQSLLALTEAGHARLAPLDAAIIDGVRASLDTLTAAEQNELVAAMQVVERLLGKRNAI